MKIQLQDTNSKLKMEIDLQVFEVMADKGILIKATESVKRYTNGVRK